MQQASCECAGGKAFHDLREGKLFLPHHSAPFQHVLKSLVHPDPEQRPAPRFVVAWVAKRKQSQVGGASGIAGTCSMGMHHAVLHCPEGALTSGVMPSRRCSRRPVVPSMQAANSQPRAGCGSRTQLSLQPSQASAAAAG